MLVWTPRPLQSRKGILLYLDGLIPSKKNSRVTNRKTGRSFPSRKYTQWHKDATEQLTWQEPGPATGDPLKVRAHLFFGTRGRADLTNKAESVMDLLVDFGVLPDDSWLVVNDIRLTGSYRKGRPGALVRIYNG